MFQSKKVGLLAKIILLILLAYMIFTLVSVRQKIADANAAVETHHPTGQPIRPRPTQSSPTPSKTAMIPPMWRTSPREKLGLVAPNDRVFNIAD